MSRTFFLRVRKPFVPRSYGLCWLSYFVSELLLAVLKWGIFSLFEVNTAIEIQNFSIFLALVISKFRPSWSAGYFQYFAARQSAKIDFWWDLDSITCLPERWVPGQPYEIRNLLLSRFPNFQSTTFLVPNLLQTVLKYVEMSLFPLRRCVHSCKLLICYSRPQGSISLTKLAFSHFIPHFFSPPFVLTFFTPSFGDSETRLECKWVARIPSGNGHGEFCTQVFSLHSKLYVWTEFRIQVSCLGSNTVVVKEGPYSRKELSLVAFQRSWRCPDPLLHYPRSIFHTSFPIRIGVPRSLSRFARHFFFARTFTSKAIPV